MGRIYNNIVETVGHTPLVKLNKVTPACTPRSSSSASFQPAQQRQGPHRHGDD